MKIARSSFIFSIGTMLSRVSGLIRDQVVLSVFGASVLLDSFFIALRIPNLFREMLAEGALGSSFTKVYSQLREGKSNEGAQLLGHSIYLACCGTILLSLIGYLCAPFFVSLLTFKASGPHHHNLIHQSVGLTKILFPYLGIAMIGSIVAGSLYQKGHFFLSAIAPLGYNLCYILGAIVLSDIFDELLPSWWEENLADPKLTGLAVGVLIGGVVQILLQLKSSLNDLRGYKFSWYPSIDDNIKKVIYLMIPAALAASTGPINLIINTNFASGLGEGRITWLITAFRLLQLPVGVFGVAVGVVILPSLSRTLHSSQGRVNDEVRRTLLNGLVLIFWLMGAACAFFQSSSHDVMTLLFQHGEFTAKDAAASAAALEAYSYAMIAYGSIKVLSSFYYAVDRTNYAMYVAVLCVFVNLGGNLILVDRFGHVGLAFTTSMTLSINALSLILGMRKYKMRRFYISLFKHLFVVIVLSYIVCQINQFIIFKVEINEHSSFLSPKMKALTNIFVAVAITSISFISSVSILLKQNPLRMIKSSFSR